jgi:nucleoside-triphosphatase THEP1
MATESTPALAAVMYETGIDINRILRDVATSLRGRGVDIGGVLQEPEAGDDSSCARLNVVDIRTGTSACITEERGKDAVGCKLDPRGLADISHCITDAIEAGVDLIIINKFGRAESEGDGLLSCIADAVSAGIPVLTTVREPYLAAWRSFHGGLAKELAPSNSAVMAWCEAHIHEKSNS